MAMNANRANVCTCTSCSWCGGNGNIWVDMDGRVVPYGDGLCDLETCDECGGRGIVEECDVCRDAWEAEWGDER